MMVLLATFIGFNYGANLSLFPSFAKDRWGLKSFGVNYGILFTAWGVGGFVMSRVSADAHGNNGQLYLVLHYCGDHALCRGGPYHDPEAEDRYDR